MRHEAPSSHWAELVTNRGTNVVSYNGEYLYLDGEEMVPFNPHRAPARRKAEDTKMAEQFGIKEKRKPETIKHSHCQRVCHHKDCRSRKEKARD